MNDVTVFKHFKLARTDSGELEVKGILNSELMNMSCRKKKAGVVQRLKTYIAPDLDAMSNSWSRRGFGSSGLGSW
jgi:hypothetical protein